MSGICGFAGTSASKIDMEGALQSMLKSMEHRGPDSSHVYTSREDGVGLGNNYLHAFSSNSDVSLAGFANTEQFSVAMDGSIIHHQSSSNGGAAAQSPHHIDRNIKAALTAYQASGSHWLSELDGPFCLALWDKQKQQLNLSRDKLGEKSLYYYVDNAQKILVFASEIKAILAYPDIQAALDFESLSIYLAFGYIPGPRTLFKNIFKLLPGERVTYDFAGGVTKTKYWHLPPIVDAVDDEAYSIRHLRELFMKGLEGYVNGCQDVAVFLSGGIDSSIIVAALKELGVPRIHTFVLGFNLDASNAKKLEDLKYARLVAKKFNTRHHELEITDGHNPWPRLMGVVRQFDDLIMTPNSYSKFLLASAVREAGLNSVLTGSAAAGACGVHRKFLDPRKRKKLLRKTEDCRTNEEKYYTLRSRLFGLDQQQKFLRQPPTIDKQDILNTLHHYIGSIECNDFLKLFLFSNLMITSTEKTLKVLDKSGMMASVELRAPFLDRALVEFSTQLPSTFDNGRTYASLKTHMKKAFESVLPREVLNRPVIGYPSYYWNNGELAQFQKQLLSRQAIEENGIFVYDGIRKILEEEKSSNAKSAGKHGWALTQFCLWYEMYIKKNSAFLRDEISK